MTHKVKKDFYYLEWRPQNPDGTFVGGWIRDPSFEYKKPELAWQKFIAIDRVRQNAMIRMVKNGKVVIERLSIPLLRRRKV